MKRNISSLKEDEQTSTAPKHPKLTYSKQQDNCWQDIVRFCVESSNNVPKIKEYEVSSYSEDTFQQLLTEYKKLGHNYINKKYNGITLLHISAFYKSETLVPLLQAGANRTIKADVTPLPNNTFFYILEKIRGLTAEELIEQQGRDLVLQEAAINWKKLVEEEPLLYYSNSQSPPFKNSEYMSSRPHKLPLSLHEEEIEWYKFRENNNSEIGPIIQLIEDINETTEMDGATFNDNNIQYQIHHTESDGNCFFHAAFGVLENGRYNAKNAPLMRQELFNFLNQFESLQDPKMPDLLKDQLQLIIESFLDEKPLATMSQQAITLHHLFKEKKDEAIKQANDGVKILVHEIIEKFVYDETLQAEIYEVIQRARSSANKQVPTIQELKSDSNQLLNEIYNDLENCALQYDKTLTEQEYRNTYQESTRIKSILEDAELYKIYLEAIPRQEYHIITEAFPILAALSNTTIILYDVPDGDMRNTKWEPDSQLLGSYRCNSEIWGGKTETIIFHQVDHYSHVEVSVPGTDLQDSADPTTSIVPFEEYGSNEFPSAQAIAPWDSEGITSYPFAGQETDFLWRDPLYGLGVEWEKG